ncbi:unnamed protein product [Calypogeia fissa]
MQLANQSMHHKEELWAQSKAFSVSREEDKEELQQQNNNLISNYDATVATLKENNERQLAEIERLKQELNISLEQMEKNKCNTEDQLKYLDGQLKLVVQQSETFKISYEEQEREWNMKLQHITTMNQYQTKILSEEFAFQIDKLLKEMNEERNQQELKVQAYKMQKLVDMENIEKRVKSVMEIKDVTIAQLKLELKMLQEQVNESVNMLDDNYETELMLDDS